MVLNVQGFQKNANRFGQLLDIWANDEKYDICIFISDMCGRCEIDQYFKSKKVSDEKTNKMNTIYIDTSIHKNITDVVTGLLGFIVDKSGNTKYIALIHTSEKINFDTWFHDNFGKLDIAVYNYYQLKEE